MKTQDEIQAHLREVITEGRMFDFRGDALLSCLDYEHAREWLKEDTTPTEWELIAHLDEEHVRAELAGYMAFAWGKVEDHRGLSANRSVDKIGAWLWVLDETEALAAFETARFENYGAPKLRAACEHLHLPMPEHESVRRMSESLRCHDSCRNGCGT